MRRHLEWFHYILLLLTSRVFHHCGLSNLSSCVELTKETHFKNTGRFKMEETRVGIRLAPSQSLTIFLPFPLPQRSNPLS